MNAKTDGAIAAGAEIEDFPGWHRAGSEALGDWMKMRIARYETRQYDWDVLKFQADFDPKYRRAQMRYMGTGGAGKTSDMNTVISEHFTFSTMVLPPYLMTTTLPRKAWI